MADSPFQKRLSIRPTPHPVLPAPLPAPTKPSAFARNSPVVNPASPTPVAPPPQSSPAALPQSLGNTGLRTVAPLTGEIEKKQQLDRRNEQRQAGVKDMLVGAAWCVGGVIVSVTSYSLASARVSSGSSEAGYVLMWGPVAYGIYRIVRGLWQFLTAK